MKDVYAVAKLFPRGGKSAPAARKQQREVQKMAKEICQDCECVFEAKSNRAKICPKCHRKRLSQCAKVRNLNKLGNDAYSKQQAERRANNGKA